MVDVGDYVIVEHIADDPCLPFIAPIASACTSMLSSQEIISYIVGYVSVPLLLFLKLIKRKTCMHTLS